MAEEKKTPAKAEESRMTKVLNWFKTLPRRIAKPFKNMVAELKKVTWPSKKKWISSSVAVLVFMLFMGVVIGVLDLGATALVKTMIGNSSSAVVEEDSGDLANDDGAAEPTAAATDDPAKAADSTADATEDPAMTAEPAAEVTEDPAETAEPAAEATEDPAEATKAPVE